MSLTITGDTHVADVVTEKPSRGRVFEKYKIDYCCGGKAPISEICEKKGISADQVLSDLRAHDAAATESEKDWSTASLSDLIDNILTMHHDYLREELPRLLQKAERVAVVHGEHHPETVEVCAVYREMKDELEAHMEKEETILFPWIRGAEKGQGASPPYPGMTMQKPVECMIHDHEKAGAALERLEELTSNYTPPADACNTYRVLYEGLSHLQKDLHTHVHKENSILFPKALALPG